MQDERVRWLAKAEEMRRQHVAFVKTAKVDKISLQRAYDDCLPKCISAEDSYKFYLADFRSVASSR